MLNQPTEPRRSWLAALLRRPLVVNVIAAPAGPGDVLVVTAPAGLSEDVVRELSQGLSDQFAGTGIRTFVLADGLTAQIIRGERE